MPIFLLPVLLALVGFLVYRKMAERKANSPATLEAAAAAGPATIPPPRKFIL